MIATPRPFSIGLAAIALAACEPSRPPALLNPSAADLAQPAPDSFKVQFETSKGSFTVQAFRRWAPLGVDRFHYLVKNGFYDGARFFRVVPSFVVQFGIHGDPKINEAWTNRTIPDDPVMQSNGPAFVTFATSGPNSRTTQIFINMAANAQLDSLGFAPFAKVIDGMRVVAQLYAEYGDGPPRGRGPDQQKMAQFGNEYLTRWFPQLDHVIRATVVQE